MVREPIGMVSHIVSNQIVARSASSSLVWRNFLSTFLSIVIVVLVPVVHSQPTLPLLQSSQELVYGTIYWQQIGKATHQISSRIRSGRHHCVFISAHRVNRRLPREQRRCACASRWRRHGPSCRRARRHSRPRAHARFRRPPPPLLPLRTKPAQRSKTDPMCGFEPRAQSPRPCPPSPALARDRGPGG